MAPLAITDIGQLATTVAALAAGVGGIVLGARRSCPLFLRIVGYAFASLALGLLYDELSAQLMGPGALRGFSVGAIGYAGTFFFLASSYIGALDSLVDDRSTALRRHRMRALVAPALVCLLAALDFVRERDIMDALLCIPIAVTAYFAAKHLLLPDIEMGIVRVLRPYNICILAFCLIQPLALGELPSVLAGAVNICDAALIALALPLAKRGVSAWFI